MGLLGLVVTGLFYYFADEIYQYAPSESQENLPPVDVIICLAGGRGRINAAGEVWLKYWQQAQERSNSLEKGQKPPMLYFAGIAPQSTWTQLAKQLSPAVLTQIRIEDVILENESSNTDTNAQFFIQQAQKWKWKTGLLLTSSYHMKRAAWIFRTLLKKNSDLIELKLYPVYQEPFGVQQWRAEANGIRVTFLEYLKWLYYRWVWPFK